MPVPLSPSLPAWAPWLLLAHSASTWAMTGLIWFVQVVHYPLLARLGEAYFRPLHHQHCARTGLVVGPLMLVELGSAAVLAWLLAPAPGPARTAAWAGLLLLGLIWASTALVQIPQHNRLAMLGPDPATLESLVRGNWLRTMAWTLRAALVVPALTKFALVCGPLQPG